MRKRIVICCDGTWNYPDQMSRDGVESPTNVVKTERTIASTDPDGRPQIVWYQRGVGVGSRFVRFVGGVFGRGLEENVQEAYRFLADNFEPGDEIFLFGFSRGAFTARSVVGMIRNVGLLRREHLERFHAAYDWYSSMDSRRHPRSDESAAFRAAYSREPEIHFVGVWDTVGSRGIPLGIANGWNQRRHGFHDMTLTRIVRNAFQALAVDERRGAFRPAVWTPRPQGAAEGQRIEQVWFPGVHANVGGGYPDTGLSDIALCWMVERAKECGLAFDHDRLEAISAPDPAGRIYDSMKGLHRLNVRHIREIGTTYPETERIHPTVIQRMSTSNPLAYAPVNVLRYEERRHRARR